MWQVWAGCCAGCSRDVQDVLMWAGIDVGGDRKGFDVALISTELELEELHRLRSPREIVQLLLRSVRPAVVAIDSPESPADDGQTSRSCELRVNQDVCGIRWTPDAATIDANPNYYGWIINGYRVWTALRAEGLLVIEVFPTASWTRWLGARNGRSRAQWSREGLRTLGITGVPSRTNQDQRDAIAAAWTARAAAMGQIATGYEPIVIPN